MEHALDHHGAADDLSCRHRLRLGLVGMPGVGGVARGHNLEPDPLRSLLHSRTELRHSFESLPQLALHHL